MRGSEALYNSLAAGYDEHFAVAHRRAYDDLAWERVVALLPTEPTTVVDIGCGVGRWAERFIALGHEVIGIEPASEMAAQARKRLGGFAFQLHEGRIEDIDLPVASAGLVVAMGSLQYSHEPAAAIRKAARWLRPGGAMCVLVDSLVALVLELVAAGRGDEARERLATRRGVWAQGALCADLHLFDAASLSAAMSDTGLEQVCCRGLLVGSSAIGRKQLAARLDEQWEAQMGVEAVLSEHVVMADCGKQLLCTGVKG